jgi:hypothetical protein
VAYNSLLSALVHADGRTLQGDEMMIEFRRTVSDRACVRLCRSIKDADHISSGTSIVLVGGRMSPINIS